MLPDSQSLIGKRYRLLDTIGTGSMGAVYRAKDRLTGKELALKRVSIPELYPSSPAPFYQNILSNERLALAQEFKTLASLRHPHIITVLDYGFDSNHLPFFTMNLLDAPLPITQAGKNQPLADQIALLTQTLQALAYLHHRGILHRDLKPSNVLVSNGQVNVLDFGLSAQREQARGRAGTLDYMAPEVLEKGAASESSDLYAVGVLAYEMLTGRLPFDGSGGRLMTEILHSQPDFAPIPDPLRPVVKKLLAKDPRQRYPDARATIEALSAAAGLPAPVENAAIRESFLKAARFVGRDEALNRLTQALAAALGGQGSAWLVGGESGVGKSRLLDELRIHAMVSGATVLVGQGVAGQSAPYSLWHEILYRLALIVPLNHLELGVLHAIAPNLGKLLGVDIAPAPALDGPSAQQRLVAAILSVIRRAAQSTPIVLLLEDLHWCDESIEPIKALSRAAAGLPLLVVGSYRHDERPGLAGMLPDMQELPLERLNSQAIAELSRSMLGKAGAKPQVIRLLEEETEGNVFFLTEAVRALAEKAGGLSQVGQAPLPETITSSGILKVVQQRLSRVPPGDRELLKLAAVGGRAVELPILKAIAPQADLETWLTHCANLAVLEAQEGNWRFAHDKLREAMLAGLNPAESSELHRRVAEAIEAVHPNDSAYAAALAEHWHHANEPQKEAPYARKAGEFAASRYANDVGVRFLTRAIDLLSGPNPAEHFELLTLRERIFDLQGKRAEQQQDVAALQQLAEQAGDARLALRAALAQAHYRFVIADYPAAVEEAQRAIAIAQQENDPSSEASGLLIVGDALNVLSRPSDALHTLEKALPLAAQNPALEARILRSMSILLGNRRQLDDAFRALHRALEITRQTGDRSAECDVLLILGNTAVGANDTPAARAYYEQSLAVAREIGYRWVESKSINNLGHIMVVLFEYERATEYFAQSIALAQDIEHRGHDGIGYVNLGLVALQVGLYADAVQYLEKSVHAFRSISSGGFESRVLAILSRAHLRNGNPAAAQQVAEQAWQIAARSEDNERRAICLVALGTALAATPHRASEASEALAQAQDICRANNLPLIGYEAAAGLAQLALDQGHLAAAQELAEELSPAITEGKLDFIDEPIEICLTCYRIFAANHDERAAQILASASRLLQARSMNLRDPRLIQAFENAPAHRMLQALREKRRMASALNPGDPIERL